MPKAIAIRETLKVVEEPDIGSPAAGPTATLSQIADVVVVLNSVPRSADVNQLGKCKSKHFR